MTSEGSGRGVPGGSVRAAHGLSQASPPPPPPPAAVQRACLSSPSIALCTKTSARSNHCPPRPPPFRVPQGSRGQGVASGALSRRGRCVKHTGGGERSSRAPCKSCRVVRSRAWWGSFCRRQEGGGQIWVGQFPSGRAEPYLCTVSVTAMNRTYEIGTVHRCSPCKDVFKSGVTRFVMGTKVHTYTPPKTKSLQL